MLVFAERPFASNTDPGKEKETSDEAGRETEESDGGWIVDEKEDEGMVNVYPWQVVLILAVDVAMAYTGFVELAIKGLFLRQLLSQPPYEYEEKQAEDYSILLPRIRSGISAIMCIAGAFAAQSEAIGPFKILVFDAIGGILANTIESIAAVPATEEGIPGNPRLKIWVVSTLIDAFTSGPSRAVSMPFGAMQFRKGQDRWRQLYFGQVYMMWNIAASAAYFGAPEIRRQGCYGESSCFTWAFGSAAILWTVSSIAFIAGRPWYKVPVAKRNITKDFFGLLWIALRKWWASKEKPGRTHWLDYGEEKYGKGFVKGTINIFLGKLFSGDPLRFFPDVKRVFMACRLFFLYCVYFALYDVTGPRWLFQRRNMVGTFGDAIILPDQIGGINPILIVILIPLFDYILYPFLAKFNILTRPLQRIITGGFVTILAQVCAIVVEYQLDPNYPVVPSKGQARLSLFNTLPNAPGCDIQASFSGKLPSPMKKLVIKGNSFQRVENKEGKYLLPFDIPTKETIDIIVKASMSGDCEGFAKEKKTAESVVKVAGKNAINLAYFANGTHLLAYMSQNPDSIARSKEDAYNTVRVVFNVPGGGVSNDTEIYITDAASNEGSTSIFEGKKASLSLGGNEMGDFELKHEKNMVGERKVCIRKMETLNDSLCALNANGTISYFFFAQGGNYNIFVWLMKKANDYQLRANVEVVADPNEIHMFWQLPQILLLTIGEIMFSVTTYAPTVPS